MSNAQKNDSLLSIQRKIIVLEESNKKLIGEVDYINKLYSTRISDFYFWSAVVVTLLLAISITSWFSSGQKAKQEAQNELEKMKKDFDKITQTMKENLDEIENKKIEIEQDFETLKESIFTTREKI